MQGFTYHLRLPMFSINEPSQLFDTFFSSVSLAEPLRNDLGIGFQQYHSPKIQSRKNVRA